MLVIIACSPRQLSEQDKQLFLSNQIQVNTIKIVTDTVNSVSQLRSYDKDFNEIEIKGVLIKVKPNNGTATVNRLRNRLGATPDNVYFYDNNYGYDDDEIAVVPTKNDIAYLELVRTNGINYDLTAEKVLSKYKKWDGKYQLELFGAGRDWLEAKVKAKNVDWKSFSEEVAEFCPDVVYQGTGTIKALEAEMKRTKTLYLWWD
jgi:hypothetical protein